MHRGQTGPEYRPGKLLLAEFTSDSEKQAIFFATYRVQPKSLISYGNLNFLEMIDELAKLPVKCSE